MKNNTNVNLDILLKWVWNTAVYTTQSNTEIIDTMSSQIEEKELKIQEYIAHNKLLKNELAFKQRELDRRNYAIDSHNIKHPDYTIIKDYEVRE